MGSNRQPHPRRPHKKDNIISVVPNHLRSVKYLRPCLGKVGGIPLNLIVRLEVVHSSILHPACHWVVQRRLRVLFSLFSFPFPLSSFLFPLSSFLFSLFPFLFSRSSSAFSFLISLSSFPFSHVLFSVFSFLFSLLVLGHRRTMLATTLR